MIYNKLLNYFVEDKNFNLYLNTLNMMMKYQQIKNQIQKKKNKIGKGVCQGCILSHSFHNLYAENIMRKAGLEEAQAGIKIARRCSNNLRHADENTFMAESEEELKSLQIKVNEESEKVGLKLNI